MTNRVHDDYQQKEQRVTYKGRSIPTHQHPYKAEEEHTEPVTASTVGAVGQ